MAKTVPVSNGKTVVLGKDFKALISAVNRFPTIGSFAGSDTISLSASKGKLHASSFGVVLSKASVTAEGDLQLVGVDERSLVPFAGLCPDTAKVYLEVVGKELILKCKRELAVALVNGTEYSMAPVKDMIGLGISEMVAKRASYLAALAFSDSSRAELCCVMLNKDNAITCSPNIVAMLQIPGMKAEKIPLPLPLAKGLKTGDILYPGVTETVLHSGVGKYSMPSPVKARTDFPLATVYQFGKEIESVMLKVDGTKFGQMITECASVLGSIARTDVVISFQSVDSKHGARLEVSAMNGGARYKATMAVQEQVAVSSFKLPLEELKPASEFLPIELSICKGKGGETFLSFADGWLSFPPIQAKAK